MRRFWPALIPLGLGAAVCALVVSFELTPGSRNAPTVGGVSINPRFVEAITLGICALVAMGLLSWPLWRRWRHAKRASLITLGFAVVIAGFCYLYGARGVARKHFGKWHDTFHYMVGAKYFPELGYLDFYDCAATAHVENTNAHSRGWQIRDLRNYRMITVEAAIERTDCEQKFSQTRWRDFRKDIALFHRYRSVPHVLRDHGYNGSPVHTFFATKLANAFDLDYGSVTALALIDVAVIALMLALVCMAFGPHLGFLFAILFFVNFSDRFYFIGGSMIRYVWMATLTSGIAMLKARRYRTAAVFMTIAALLNVFPVLFMVGIGARVVWTTVTEKRVAKRYQRFVAASAVTALLGLGLGASHANGPSNYTEFLGFIGSHSQKLTSSRTGLRYTVLHRDQVDGKPVGYKTKGRQLEQATPFLIALGGAMLLAGLVLCTRLDDVEASALFGVLLFYVAFGTVEYYYAVTPLLVLAFHRRLSERLGPPMLGALFGAMAIVLLLWRETGSLSFCNNTAMSGALLSFFALTLLYLAFVTNLLRWRRRRMLIAAALAAFSLGPAVIIGGWWWFT